MSSAMRPSRNRGLAKDLDAFLAPARAEFHLGFGEQTVDDIVFAGDAVIGELRTLIADYKERRSFERLDRLRHLDEDLPPVIKRRQRTPVRLIPFDPVTKVELLWQEK